MGEPAFFSWFSEKYPSAIIPCVEEKPQVVDGVEIPVDSSNPNLNLIEFDNLYLDLNGIIHSLAHPGDRTSPKNEEEMMVAIFDAIDRLFRIVRPRKLLYIAIDGVAPFAKMKQQRLTKFRYSKDINEKVEKNRRKRIKLLATGPYFPADNTKEFDCNCITPGTTFMTKLTNCLHYYIFSRMNTDSGWHKIKVLLSDANDAGEGKHKIMDYIRKQRSQPEYDANIRHCLFGSDADLIMLGLATHEPNFSIIREELNEYKANGCEEFGKIGHEMKNSSKLPRQEQIAQRAVNSTNQFIFVHLCILREYLEIELKMPNLPFEYDFEGALDDWIFMCSFVYNDFLPNLLSLEIKEGGIDRAINVLKNTLYKTNGYLTSNGFINLDRFQWIMYDLKAGEDEVFKKRRPITLSAQETVQNEFANQWKCKEEVQDEVRLWEDGFKDRYYKSKFDVDENHLEFRKTVAAEYIRGLCWLLRYYYQGCADWNWYFPYHYAPFVSDFTDINSFPIKFEKGTVPMSPLDQLMTVLPPSSSSHVPESWRDLMHNPNSPIIDFYSHDFKIDVNGKKNPWPSVDRLLFTSTLNDNYPYLTDEERNRDKFSNLRLYIMSASKYDFELLNEFYRLKLPPTKEIDLCIEGIRGFITLCLDNTHYNGVLEAPIKFLPRVENNQVLYVRYQNLRFPDTHVFPAKRLKRAIKPDNVLNPTAWTYNQCYREQFTNSPEHIRASIGYVTFDPSQSQNNYSNNTPTFPPTNISEFVNSAPVPQTFSELANSVPVPHKLSEFTNSVPVSHTFSEFANCLPAPHKFLEFPNAGPVPHNYSEFTNRVPVPNQFLELANTIPVPHKLSEYTISVPVSHTFSEFTNCLPAPHTFLESNYGPVPHNYSEFTNRVPVPNQFSEFTNRVPVPNQFSEFANSVPYQFLEFTNSVPHIYKYQQGRQNIHPNQNIPNYIPRQPLSHFTNNTFQRPVSNNNFKRSVKRDRKFKSHFPYNPSQ